MSANANTAAPSINGSNRPSRAAKAKPNTPTAKVVKAIKKSKKGRKTPKTKRVTTRDESGRDNINTTNQDNEDVHMDPTENDHHQEQEADHEDLTTEGNNENQAIHNGGQPIVSSDVNQQYLDFVRTFPPSQPTMGPTNLNLAHSNVYPQVPIFEQPQTNTTALNGLGAGQEWTLPYFMNTGYVQQAITDPLANETQKVLLGYALHPKAVENHILYGRNRPNVPIAILQAIAHGKFVELEKVIHDPTIPFDGENTLRVNDAGQLSATVQKKYAPIRSSVSFHYALNTLASAYSFLFPNRTKEFADYIRALLALEFAGTPLTCVILYDRALRNKVASQRHLTLYHEDEALKAQYLYNANIRNIVHPQRNTHDGTKPNKAQSKLVLPPRQDNKADEPCVLYTMGRCETDMSKYKPTGCVHGRKHTAKTT